MKTHNIGYPRIGKQLDYLTAYRKYWLGQIKQEELLLKAKSVRLENWKEQQLAGIQLIPCNDFSYYDLVLDTCILFGAIPERFRELSFDTAYPDLDLGFAMANGYFDQHKFIEPMEASHWFDTMYHYIVPEFMENQHFQLRPWKIIQEFKEAKRMGFTPKPVLLGPISFLLLGKEVETGFHRMELIGNLLPKYIDLIQQLDHLELEYLQLDEPCFRTELSAADSLLVNHVYKELSKRFPALTIILATYFKLPKKNIPILIKVPVKVIHIDLVNNPDLLAEFFNQQFVKTTKILSLGIVDGKNIWRNDYQQSLAIIHSALRYLGKERVWLGPNLSLQHVPYDIELETDNSGIKNNMRQWFSFAKQKLQEISSLARISLNEDILYSTIQLIDNNEIMENRRDSQEIHKPVVKEIIRPIYHAFTKEETVELGQPEIENPIAFTSGKKLPYIIDAERCRQKEHISMVSYMDGIVASKFGWVQTKGDTCIIPLIIYGDIRCKKNVSKDWTPDPALGTPNESIRVLGPLSLLKRSYIRTDQPFVLTALQLSVCLQQMLSDLLRVGPNTIQLTEPELHTYFTNPQKTPTETALVNNLLMLTLPEQPGKIEILVCRLNSSM
ncbi:hypothetical protein [Flavihumibacter sp. CACIAM 22H1]|uniref:hypothetical protein n=1 Tax=Flavihumibacter sp. CACIAM 22H1 TaxID=1812911 RepID=UPI0007A8FB0B|nr:hypothetical protein [Flavihumibacter sp. CACIAM 22H1]KYP12973.1 MAG: hypothetical protein A1D16_19535 [Flavihumibacter sp. CACIAM 22H1]